VVGRVQLALNVNGIPGVELEGDFLLDINAIVNLGGGRLLQRKRQDLRRAVGR
jgi:hypothetical protein